MTEDELRARVSEIALEWERTPYVHEGRIKGQCADCTFVVRVYQEAGIIGDVAIPHYSPQAHLNRGGGAYLHLVEKLAKRRIDESEARVGDLVLYRVSYAFSHGAIVIAPGWPNVIHAHMTARFVIRSLGNAAELSVERRFYSFV